MLMNNGADWSYADLKGLSDRSEDANECPVDERVSYVGLEESAEM